MNKQQIPESSGFTPKADVLSTFALAPKFFELSGPGTLFRLVQNDRVAEERRQPDRFWFEEELMVRVENQARLELSRQQRQVGQPFSAPFDSLVTLFMRHVFRNDLARRTSNASLEHSSSEWCCVDIGSRAGSVG